MNDPLFFKIHRTLQHITESLVNVLTYSTEQFLLVICDYDVTWNGAAMCNRIKRDFLIMEFYFCGWIENILCKQKWLPISNIYLN